MENKIYEWNAAEYFKQKTAKNKLANNHNFHFAKISGVEGFEEALSALQTKSAFICVSDISPGYTEINNSPKTRRVKTIFMAMRHQVNNMDARQKCMDIMRELFRQFLSALILEKTSIEQGLIHVDPRITFNEISQYFFNGCACAQFSIAIDIPTSLIFNQDEWTD